MITEARSGYNKRVETTRHAILDAAVALYHARGVDQITVSAIIDASGVGRATFYRHFEDQDDVLSQALQRDYEGMLAAFEAQRHQHRELEAQIIEDMIWFIHQLTALPALGLVFGDPRARFLPRINATLNEFREAALVCVGPTFQRALDEGRIRPGVTKENYLDWAAFVTTSLQVVNTPLKQDEFQLRDTLRRFFLPSLIRD